MIKHRKSSREVVELPALEILKTQKDTTLSNPLSLTLLWAGELDQMVSISVWRWRSSGPDNFTCSVGLRLFSGPGENHQFLW